MTATEPSAVADGPELGAQAQFRIVEERRLGPWSMQAAYGSHYPQRSERKDNNSSCAATIESSNEYSESGLPIRVQFLSRMSYVPVLNCYPRYDKAEVRRECRCNQCR